MMTAPTRQNRIRNVAASIGSAARVATSSAVGVLVEADLRPRVHHDRLVHDGVGDAVHEGTEGMADHGQRKQHDHAQHQDLRHERQRHFLHLGKCLEQADDDADDQRGNQHRPGDGQDQHQRRAGDLDGFG